MWGRRVAFDDNNHLYVTDSFNHRVQKFDINGTYLLKFRTLGSGNGQLNHPLGITIHNDKVYIVENSGHRISVFHCDGQFSHIFGTDHLSNPWYVAVSNDQLLVANTNHHCISIFTLDGKYVGKYDTGRRKLLSPRGIATDMYGFIIVNDAYSKGCVSIFNKDGVFIHSFGSEGPDYDQFLAPHGIAISPTGDIYHMSVMKTIKGYKSIPLQCNKLDFVNHFLLFRIYLCTYLDDSMHVV